MSDEQIGLLSAGGSAVFIDASANGPSTVLPAFYRALRKVTRLTADNEANAGTYTYRYVSLDAVVTVINEALADEGLAVWTVPTVIENRVHILLSLLSEAGEYVTFTPLSLPASNTPQGTGSAITYARRYTLMTLFNLVTEDDDGQAAQAAAQQAARSAFRTEAERAVHELFQAAPAAWGQRVREQFRFYFGCGLSQLPPARHDEALTYVQEQLEAIEAEEAADGSGY